MKTQITKSSVLVFTSLGVIGSVYTPQIVHKKATPEIICSYLNGYKYYNPMKFKNNWDKSEQRKQELLNNIRTIRTQIRTMAEQQRNHHQAVDKLIETVASTMMSQTRAREHQMKAKRASELRTLPRFINYEALKKKTGIVEIEFA